MEESLEISIEESLRESLEDALVKSLVFLEKFLPASSKENTGKYLEEFLRKIPETIFGRTKKENFLKLSLEKLLKKNSGGSL